MGAHTVTITTVAKAITAVTAAAALEAAILSQKKWCSGFNGAIEASIDCNSSGNNNGRNNSN